MKLKIDNVGGIRLGGVLYTAANHTWTGMYGRVELSNNGPCFLTRDGTEAEDAAAVKGRPILDVSGRNLNLSDAPVAQTGGNMSFGGGVLYGITLRVNVYRGDSVQDSGGNWTFSPSTAIFDRVSAHILGVVSMPEPVKIYGLDMPRVAQYEESPARVRERGASSTVKFAESSPLRLNRRVWSLGCYSLVDHIHWQRHSDYLVYTSSGYEQHSHIYGINYSVVGKVSGGYTALFYARPVLRYL